MTLAFTRIPLQPRAQRFSIALGEATYNLRTTYNDADEGGWVLDIGDAAGTIILAGIPLVTGADLLQPFTYLNLGGSLFVTTDRNTGDAPTYDGLGLTSQLFFVTQA